MVVLGWKPWPVMAISVPAAPCPGETERVVAGACGVTRLDASDRGPVPVALVAVTDRV